MAWRGTETAGRGGEARRFETDSEKLRDDSGTGLEITQRRGDNLETRRERFGSDSGREACRGAQTRLRDRLRETQGEDGRRLGERHRDDSHSRLAQRMRARRGVRDREAERRVGERIGHDCEGVDRSWRRLGQTQRARESERERE